MTDLDSSHDQGLGSWDGAGQLRKHIGWQQKFTQMEPPDGLEIMASLTQGIRDADNHRVPFSSPSEPSA